MATFTISIQYSTLIMFSTVNHGVKFSHLSYTLHNTDPHPYHPRPNPVGHRKTRLIEGNAKCRHLPKIDL
jgi:hypothetical protein